MSSGKITYLLQGLEPLEKDKKREEARLPSFNAKAQEAKVKQT